MEIGRPGLLQRAVNAFAPRGEVRVSTGRVLRRRHGREDAAGWRFVSRWRRRGDLSWLRLPISRFALRVLRQARWPGWRTVSSSGSNSPPHRGGRRRRSRGEAPRWGEGSARSRNAVHDPRGRPLQSWHRDPGGGPVVPFPSEVGEKPPPHPGREKTASAGDPTFMTSRLRGPACRDPFRESPDFLRGESGKVPDPRGDSFNAGAKASPAGGGSRSSQTSRASSWVA